MKPTGAPHLVARAPATSCGIRGSAASAHRDTLEKWLRDALRLWSSAGIDPHSGHFQETLNNDGKVRPGGVRRLFVQARQIATFAQAAHLGLPVDKALPVRAFRAMSAGYVLAPDLPIWASWIDQRGGRHGIPNLYDHAFVLYALAWLVRLTGEPEYVRTAIRGLNAILSYFSLDEGFASDAARDPARLEQNPQMHLLEALLALADATGMARFLDPARSIVRLFERRLACPTSGFVYERYRTGWRSPDPAVRTAIEPGHQFEWAWLLSQFQRLAGIDLSARIEPLMLRSARLGRAPTTGLVVETMSIQGVAVRKSARLWAQAEAIRALACCSGAGAGAEQPLIDSLVQYHLQPAPTGGYIDRVDAAGVRVSTWMPASALYHVAGMCFACGVVPTPSRSPFLPWDAGRRPGR